MQQEELEGNAPDSVASNNDPAEESSSSPNQQQPKIRHVWSWKETDLQFFQHPPASIVGDPSDGWIRYGRFSNQRLEAAYANQDVTCNVDETYSVNFRSMRQINLHTGFQRQVQRTIETPKVWCWRETEGLMWKHDPSTIYRNPSDCWIQYNQTACDLLEEAFWNGDEEVAVSNGFVVTLEDMIQTNETTGFEREVQRVDAKKEEEQQPQPDQAASSPSSAVPAAAATPKKVWCWKETDGFQWNHHPSTFHGDPNNCWIKYDQEASDILEDAFQSQPFGMVSPMEGYNVNLAIMKQINIATGFERDVQRVDPIDEEEEADENDGAQQDSFNVTQAREMETRLQDEMQFRIDDIDQKLEDMAAMLSERQEETENELKVVHNELQETKSELRQTTQERDELRQEVAAIRETLEALQNSVDVLLQQQHGKAKESNFDPSSQAKKRVHSDLDTNDDESEQDRMKKAMYEKML